MVRILAEDHDLGGVERGRIERGEDLRAGRIDPGAAGLALAQEPRQRLHLVALQVVADMGLP